MPVSYLERAVKPPTLRPRKSAVRIVWTSSCERGEKREEREKEINGPAPRPSLCLSMKDVDRVPRPEHMADPKK